MKSMMLGLRAAHAVFPATIALLLGAGGAQAMQVVPATGTTVPQAAPIAKAAVTDPQMARVYDKTGWQMLWSDDAANALDVALAERARHGLDRVVFLPDPGGEPDLAQRDIARTRAALDYASALARGRADPATLQAVYTLPRPNLDFASGLVKAVQAGDLRKWLDGLAPQDAGYARMSQAYLDLGKQAKDAAPPVIAPTVIATAGLIHVGNRDRRVPAIAAQLVESGYLDKAAVGKATLYTQPMADALAALQRDYGIAADGVIGPATLAVLNLGPEDRARALAVAMERSRWLTRTPPPTRIDVNTAAAQLEYYRDGQLVDTRKVIVGEPGKETPGLQSPIYRLVANPTWTVPKSIQNGELAHVGRGYLRAHNMVMRDGYIVQQPGPDNALGLVKFDMRNDYAIYLHDTSAPALFDRSQRHLSHGCVRVEDAAGFAQRLAEDEGVADAWAKAQALATPTYVPLPHEIPVRLLYQTVFVAEDGKVAFRTDPYGWNDAVAAQLGYAKSDATRAQAKAIDVSP